MEIEKIYVPSLTAIYTAEMWVFAGVHGAGKTSMMGAWGSRDGVRVETLLAEEDISFIERKMQQGTAIRMNYIGLDTLDEHLIRIENRARKGGASAEAEVVKRQFQCRWMSLAKVLPLCKEAHFYDNTNGFRCVGHYCDHTFQIPKESCRWFFDFLEEYCLGAESDIADCE